MKLINRNTVTLILIVNGLYGCARLTFPKRDNLSDLSRNLNSLNGYYRNSAVDTSQMNLWHVLNNKVWKDTSLDKYNPQYLFVELIVKDNHSVTANLFNDTFLIGQKVLKGKIKGNYFSVRRKVNYLGVPLIYMKESEWKLQLGKDQNGNLHVDAAYFSAKIIFIASGGIDSNDNSVYQLK